MAASDHLSKSQFGDYEITHSSRHLYNNTYDHTVEAHHQGKKVGHLWWVTGGEITNISVEPEHRRKGLATAMYSKAKSIDPKIHHATERTKQGDKWSQSLPDYTSPDNIL